MDRTLKRGCIGLCVSWLQSHRDEKDVHSVDKAILSAAEGRAKRVEGRKAFKDLLDLEGGVFQAVWEKEFELYGSNEEAETIPCAMR